MVFKSTTYFLLHWFVVISSLNIQQTPQDLLITPEMEKEAKIKCQHGDAGYNYMYWYQQKTVSDSIELIGMLINDRFTAEKKFTARFTTSGHATKDAFLHVASSNQEDSAVYFCAAGTYTQPAYFGQGTKVTVLDPNINVTPPTVRILNVSDEEACAQEKVTLVCVAYGFYPDHVDVSWTVDDENRITDVGTDEAATRNGTFYTITSRLNIEFKTEWANAKTFVCNVRFYNGTGYSNHSDYTIGTKIDFNKGLSPESYVRKAKTSMLGYSIIIAQSFVYGLIILVIAKRQGKSK